MSKAKSVKKVAAKRLRPLTIGDLKNLLGKAILEPAFLAQLTLKPDATLKALGIAPSAGARRFFDKLQGRPFPEACALVNPDSAPRPPNIVFFD